MVTTCVDAVIETLSSRQDRAPYGQRKWLRDCLVDLRFIKMFLWCSVSLDFDADLSFMFTSVESIWERDGTSEDLNKLPSEQAIKVLDKVQEKILLSKREIKTHCEHLIYKKSFKCKPLTIHVIRQFLDAIVINMDDLASRVADEILPAKNQIEILKGKLLVFWNLVEFTALRCVDCKALEDFNVHVLIWANKAAYVTFLYWVAVQDTDISYLSDGDGDNSYCCGLVGNNESKIDLFVTDLLQKVNPCTPVFIDMCFAVIKLTKSSHSHIILFEEFVPSFVDFLLQNLMFTSQDDFRILREGLIWLISFLAGPPVNYSENSELILFQIQIDAVLIEASHVICLLGEAKVAFTSEKTVLAKLMKMIEQVKGNLYKHYGQLPQLSWSYFPRTNGLEFIESLLSYIKDLELEEAKSSHPKFVTSLKHMIFTIKDELMSLRPFLKDVLGLLNDHKELKDLSEEIISVAYQAELAIKQSFFIDHPFFISYVLWKIQAVQSKVTKFKDHQIYASRVISSFTSSANMHTLSVPTSVVDEVVVGFDKDAEELIKRLTRGTATLDIVSIVGTPGIGKTTLAKKLYKEPAVTYYFHKRAFCTVSQVYRTKDILLDLLSNLIVINHDMRNMDEDDLAHMLRKSLSDLTYLIVLDDIWDIKAWDSVKSSFPDDRNGSRIMFTSRIHDVALQAKLCSKPYELSFLTIDESWDLLQRKVFHKNACPPYLYEVGRSIAENCKGLPLAIVVIAGVLTKSDMGLSWWQKVADGLSSFFYGEGVLDILELSYKNLPEALKSCFLYLGAFPEDTIFRAEYITKLWVAERFVLKSDRGSMDETAKEFLNYLDDRSLLIVTGRSLAGNVKRFRLHDVIREFCISKAKKEHLVYLVHGHQDNFSTPLIYDHYRICVQAECTSFLDANPRGPALHSLLCFENGYNRYKRLPSSFFRNFRLIQVLNLRPVEFLDFPTRITMLVHLRYLALTCVSISSPIPPTIANLQNLETMLIEGPDAVYLPNTIWKMKRLRHFGFPSGCILALDDVTSEAFSNLPNLESLGHVRIRDKEEGEELLRRLPNLRKLSCECWEWPEQLVNLTKLESLSIVWSRDIKLESLSFPANLRKLSLDKFSLSSKELSTMVEKLPCLKALKLMHCRFHGKRWGVEDHDFSNLRYLTLASTRIEHWKATTYSFPLLEKLVLEECHELSEIPLCFGELSTLRALEVRYCSEGLKTSANQIHKEQLDLGNDSLKFVMS